MSSRHTRLANLPLEQRAALERKLLARKAGQHPDAVPPRTNSERAPLSYNQLEFWFLHQAGVDLTPYNITFGCRLRGHLDRHALHASINRVIARHEALRVTFQTTPDEPYQHIVPTLTLELPVMDLSGLAAGERDTRLEEAVISLHQKRSISRMDHCSGPFCSGCRQRSIL